MQPERRKLGRISKFNSKPTRKRTLGKSKRRWKDNVKMDIK